MNENDNKNDTAGGLIDSMFLSLDDAVVLVGVGSTGLAMIWGEWLGEGLFGADPETLRVWSLYPNEIAMFYEDGQFDEPMLRDFVSVSRGFEREIPGVAPERLTGAAIWDKISKQL